MEQPAKVVEVVRDPIARRGLTLLAFVTFCFVVLALLQQRTNSRQDHAFFEIHSNQAQIDSIAAARQKAIAVRAEIDYKTCLDTAELHKAFRDLAVQSLKQTKAAPVTAVNTAKQKAANIAAVTSLISHIKIPDCGPDPSP